MYTVINLDLSVVQANPVEIVPPGKRMTEIIIFDLPGGASFRLKPGRSNVNGFAVTKSFSMEPRGEEDANDGLYWTNANAQPATNVEIIVVFGGQLQPVV